MLLAMTTRTPALSSLYGAVSRLEPHPLEMALTMTPKPPFFTESFWILPPRRPTRQKRARVSS